MPPETESFGMLKESERIRVERVISLVKDYFGDNASAFYVIPETEDDSLCVECLLYRSFKVCFSLGDPADIRSFPLTVWVYISYKSESLEMLMDTDDLPSGDDRESILQNLKALDTYLQWCMTDAQKKTYGLI